MLSRFLFMVFRCASPVLRQICQSDKPITTDIRGSQKAAAVWICAGICWLAAGCSGDSSPPPTGIPKARATSAKSGEDTLRYAISLLESNDGLDAAEVALRQSKTADEPLRRLIFGQMQNSLVEQLNRWLGSQKQLDAWKPDPLLDSLPEPLQALPAVKGLGEMRFANADGAVLREQLWLREISNWVCGDANDALERGRRLFDWTVRNIQLDEPLGSDDEQVQAPYLAWHLLTLGHGQAQDRAWLFMLLARQQALDVVVLRPASEKATTLLGLLHDGELYLFAAQLGLAIPGSEGKGVATLTQVAEDDRLLRRLDLDSEHPYPLASSDFEKVTAAIEASPVYLQRRTQVLESRLLGDEKLVLSLDATALAARLANCSHVSQAELWVLPFERLQEIAQRSSPGVKRLAAEFQPMMAAFGHIVKKKYEPTMALWRGRVQHLLGRFTGEKSSNYFYQLTRMPDAEIEQRMAAEGAARQGDTPEVQQQRKLMSETIGKLYRRAKQDASYWLGLVAFERGNYTTAIDYFQKRTLEASSDNPWSAGARYNLGRAYEALGKRSEAVDAYRSDESPQQPGNLLRARWLEADAKVAAEEKTAAP